MQGPHLTAEKFLQMFQMLPNSLGKFAILPGSKDRLIALLDHIQEPLKDFSFFEYEMHTGTYKDQKITVANSGRYAPDSAIMAEIALAGGSQYLIRLGTCGTLQEDILIGDLFIVTGALREEGTTSHYVPDNFPCVADLEVSQALIEAAKELKLRYHCGLVWTTDALLRETPEKVERMRQLKVKAVDMVSSSPLVLAHLRGGKAGSILAVTDNLLTGEVAFLDIRTFEAEQNLIKVALRAVELLK